LQADWLRATSLAKDIVFLKLRRSRAPPVEAINKFGCLTSDWPRDDEAFAKPRSLKFQEVLAIVLIVICRESTDKFSDLAVTSGEVVCYVMHGSRCHRRARPTMSIEPSVKVGAVIKNRTTNLDVLRPAAREPQFVERGFCGVGVERSTLSTVQLSLLLAETHVLLPENGNHIFLL
jgi:hypothetical protein